MTSAIIGIALCAGLFMLFGLVRQRACNGGCAGCTASCERHEEGKGHVH